MIKDSETPIPMQGGGVAPEGVSFDGTSDYLSRSTDLINNQDSKTFTFSCWFYSISDSNRALYYSVDNTIGKVNYILAYTDHIVLYMEDSTGGRILYSTNIPFTTDNSPCANQWNHIVISITTLSSTVSSAWLNDKELSITWEQFDIGSTIDFSAPNHSVGSNLPSPTIAFKGRLSHLFLDYTYRDLSIEANRRLFITADGKPADGLASLNPILYLPMTDASTAHVNLGTGGNFVQNGLIETADVGANYMTCRASKFKSGKYLSTSSLTGATNSNVIVISGIMKALNQSPLNESAMVFGATPSIEILQESTGNIRIRLNTTLGGAILYAVSVNSFPLSKSMQISVSINTSSQSLSRFFINGNSEVFNITVFNNTALDLSSSKTNFITINKHVATEAVNNGEIYIDNTYIDLATNNPFWDSDTNKPIPVRKVMANLGSNPLICMPIDASNPTKNYGSGGDFTLNGGGLVGARGASEYIARSAKFPTNAAYLEKTGNMGMNDGKTFSMVICWNPSTLGHPFGISIPTTHRVIEVQDNYVSSFDNSTTTYTLRSGISTTTNLWNTLIVSIDMSSTSKRTTYLNGVLQNNYSEYVNRAIALSQASSSTIGVQQPGGVGNTVAGDVSFVYFTTDYIDFSQEVNRNKFVNQLGYPRDLKPLIADGTIPNPLIYLPFDDTSNLGKNLGTGGHFTVNGTVTAGADFTI